MENNQQPQIQIKMNDDVLKGSYANYMQVMHTPEEFVLDFINLLPPNGIVTNRIMISPGHMKRIINALQENLKIYEKNNGEIKNIGPAVAPSEKSSSHKIGFEE